MDCPDVDFSSTIEDVVSLFKRLYLADNELSNSLSETQKENLIENNLKFHFNEIIEANMFRFGKISNRDDDEFYQLIKGETDYE